MALERPYPPAIDRTALSLDATAPASVSPSPSLTVARSAPVPTGFFALAVGLLAINLCAAQPLIGIIAPAIHLAPGAYGLISMMTLLGYAAGLILLVPLTDLTENRRLILGMFASNVVALAVTAGARQPWLFLAATFITGMTTSAIQMLVPLAASMTPPERRGRVVGNIMGGVMLGILLSRPLASIIAAHFGWRSVFASSAGLIAVVTVFLIYLAPRHRPETSLRYIDLVASLWTLMRVERVLQVRALTAGLCFASFSFYWTVIALRLGTAPFQLGTNGIALFAFAGCGGSIIAPIAGRLGDRGWTNGATVVLHLAIVLAIVSAWIVGAAGFAGGFFASHPDLAIVLMMATAVLLDIGVIGEQTLGRRAINMIRPEARGRLNGLFTGGFFIGGAIGSAAAGLAWAWGGWTATSICGLVTVLLALCLSLATWRRQEQITIFDLAS
jgi:predicted MFS family arabinose efflux permease